MHEARARREARWQALAQRRGWGAWLLLPLAGLYGALTALRRRLYAASLLRSYRLPVPVVVVGNVVVGGAGKTPTTIALVRHLQARGWRPGVVSRGHGRSASVPMSVGRDTLATDCGDEPKLIFEATGVPVFVSSDRVGACQYLLDSHPQTNILVCDDGLQHLKLRRDLSIVVFDDRGLGNGWLLPAGLLREPWPPRAVNPARTLVLQHGREGVETRPVEVPAGIHAGRARRRLAPHATDLDGHSMALSQLRAVPLVALAGVARPDAFFDMLRGEGLELLTTVPLPDHAPPSDYLHLLRGHGQAFICTQKDAVKLSGLMLPPGVRVWSVGLNVSIDASFFDALDARLPPPPRTG